MVDTSEKTATGPMYHMPPGIRPLSSSTMSYVSTQLPPIEQPAYEVMPRSGMVIDQGVLRLSQLDAYARSVDPALTLEPAVKKEIAEHLEVFTDEMIDRVICLSRNCGNHRVRAADVELVLSLVYKMPYTPRVSNGKEMLSTKRRRSANTPLKHVQPRRLPNIQSGAPQREMMSPTKMEPIVPAFRPKTTPPSAATLQRQQADRKNFVLPVRFLQHQTPPIHVGKPRPMQPPTPNAGRSRYSFTPL